MQIKLTQNIPRIWPLLTTPQVQGTTVSYCTEVSYHPPPRPPAFLLLLSLPPTDTIAGSMHDPVKNVKLWYFSAQNSPKGFSFHSVKQVISPGWGPVWFSLLSPLPCTLCPATDVGLLTAARTVGTHSGLRAFGVLSPLTRMKVPWRRENCLFCF